MANQTDLYRCPSTCQCEAIAHDGIGSSTCGLPIQRDKHAHAQWIGAVCPGCAEACFSGEAVCYLLPRTPCAEHEAAIEADLARFRERMGLAR